MAAARKTTPRKLAQLLKGDLDTIVLKVLKKDPTERYWSSDAFARDIANYLDFMSMLIAEAASAEKPVTVSEMLERSAKPALARAADSNENRAAILGAIAGLHDTSGDSGKSAHLLERALALVNNSRDVALRSHLTCLNAGMIAEMGQADTAVLAITREIENAKLEHGNASECLAIRSVIAERVGDAEGALRYATMALDHFHKSGRRPLETEGSLLARVATGHRLEGDDAQANHYFELATEICRGRSRAQSHNDYPDE